MKTTEFEWKGITWIVRLDDGSYRDKAHIGGPWSSITETMQNKSIHTGFKRAMRKAIELRLGKPGF